MEINANIYIITDSQELMEKIEAIILIQRDVTDEEWRLYV